MNNAGCCELGAVRLVIGDVSIGLVEGVLAVGVDGVADAGNGAVAIDRDLLGARGGEAGGVTATKVVHEDGVGPVGLDGGIAVVDALNIFSQ